MKLWAASQEHYSDEQLLAYLDGELQPTTTLRVQSHLATCWECRARMQDIEQQVHLVTTTIMETSVNGMDRATRAKTSFLAQRRYTPDPKLARTLLSTPRLIRWGTLLLAGLTTIFLFVLLSPFSRRGATPSPGEIMARSLASESGLAEQSVHQTFQIEMEQLKPVQRKRVSELQVWSDNGGGRFASRWMTSEGKLRYALWHPAADETYQYNPAGAPAVQRLDRRGATAAFLIELPGQMLDLEKLESGFVEWLESRSWQPVSLASNFSAFVDQEGATLQAERVAVDGRIILRVRAQHTVGQFVATLILEVDSLSYRPHKLQVRFETAKQAVELRMVEKGMNLGPEAASFSPADFTSHVTVPDSVDKPSRRPGSLLAKSNDSIRSEADVISEEINIEYALHRARACRGEPIQMIRDLDGKIIVEGVVGTLERKMQLLSVLAPFGSSSRVRIRIRTVEEASPPRSASAQTGLDLNGSATLRPPSTRAIELSNEKFPIRELLEQYFRRIGAESSTSSHPGEQISVRHEVINLSNKALELSDGALMDAWALRRLAERYPLAQTRDVPPNAKWLLETMLRDHLAELKAHVNQLQSLVGPVLLSSAPAQTYAEAVSQIETGVPQVAADSGWPREVLRLFTTVNHSDRLATYLFAGSDLTETLEEAEGQLLADLGRASNLAVRTEAQIARDFADMPSPSATERAGSLP
jgi:hypothetical protein